MVEPAFYQLVLGCLLVAAALVLVALMFVSAPYGRHARRGWGPRIPAKVGWVVMELPAVLVIAACFVLGDRHTQVTAIVFLVLWEIHYLHRTFIFPFRLSAAAKPVPLLVPILAIVFNLANGYVNGRYLFTLGPLRPISWLTDPRFIAGVLLFFLGLAINLHADGVLMKLRKPGDLGYQIPRGGLFRFVSCPNYFGEMVEWTGWAIATWSLPGATFALWTVANLLPRARSHHLWYRATFPDYPPERKAVIPFLF